MEQSLWRRYLRGAIITVITLLLSFVLCLFLQNVFAISEPIITLFVFAVFLVSLLTDGYLYGILSAFVSVLAVNYAFTFPYFALNFTLTENLVSALIMIVVALLTGALTTKLKQWEAIKAEGERERMRANLLRAVSHDLRTPLTTIYGASSAILDTDSRLSDEQRLRMVKGIKEDSEWLIRMVENLLSVTKIDGGSVNLVKTPTALEELIDAVLLKFKGRYPEGQVELNIPEEFVMIPMDPILIEQVLVNLLENAVQHADGMKTLTLRVFLQKKRAVFEVIDDGCGLEKDQLDRIFTGYSRRDNDTSDRRMKGAGIGLSVCASIIGAHGGSITAENRREGGAIFRFSLLTEENVDDEQ